MTQQATEALLKAVNEIQPEAMIAAINDGANPYARLPSHDGQLPSMSALEAVSRNDLVRSVLGHEDGLGGKLAHAVNHMLTTLPQNKEELQQIADIQIETLGNEARAIRRFAGIEERAKQMGGHLSAQAREHLWLDRRGPGVLNAAFMDAPAWRVTADQMNGMDLAKHRSMATMAREKGEALGTEDVKLYTLRHPHVAISGNAPVIELTRDEPAAAQQWGIRTHEPSVNFSFETPKSFAELKNTRDQAKAPETHARKMSPQ